MTGEGAVTGGDGATGGDGFYAAIEPVADFESLADPTSYRPLPDDWWIVAADIAGSTRAIGEGRYREVNSVGVSVIAAVRNACRPVEVPYVFGGDGATLCVPDSCVAAVRTALAGTVAMADGAFDLVLRGAVVPVSYVRGRSLDVLVARHRVSEHFVQCALFGGGAEYVESALKSGWLPEAFGVSADAEAEADFRGLECRWDEVPSPSEETVALIIEAAGEPATTPEAVRRTMQTYRWVMERLREIYGEAELCRPVVESALHVTLSGSKLAREARVKSWREGVVGRLWAALRLRLFALIGRYLFWRGTSTSETDWGAYKADLVANTDFRKFDGTMRLVLSGSRDQRAELEAFLDGLRAAGTVRYGLHVSDAAVVTCLVEKRQGGHFHFVDGAAGGYAAAAADLKARVGGGGVESR